MCRMRLPLRTPLIATLIALGTLATPSGNAATSAVTVINEPGPGGFTSGNVSYVASIPTGAGVSARLVPVKGQQRLYVSSAHSLTIYDVTNPALPVPLGALPFYNWENEDVAVSKDGNTTILTEFMDALYIHVVDTSNPAAPQIVGTLELDGSHTAECADPACHFLYGSNGKTYDIRDHGGPLATSRTPVELPRDQWWSTQVGVRGGHALHQDAAGYWIADSDPTVVMFKEVTPQHVVRISGGVISQNTNYEHNNIRPAADKYRPRRGGSHGKALRPGELLLTEGESNFAPQCKGSSGAFSTWSMVGWDKGKPMQQLHVLRPVQGDYTNGDPAVNVMGCSGHWFTVREDMPSRYKGQYLVAAAWYEHGTRFLAVNAKTGAIKQVGFFQPLRGSASSAYWIGNTGYVYVVDYQRGIDILKFDAAAAPPTVAQTNASWLAKLHTVDSLAAQDRFWCRRAMEHPTGA